MYREYILCTVGNKKEYWLGLKYERWKDWDTQKKQLYNNDECPSQLQFVS